MGAKKQSMKQIVKTISAMDKKKIYNVEDAINNRICINSRSIGREERYVNQYNSNSSGIGNF